MKKIISVSMIFVLMFAFAACSSAEYIDVPVTDENGQAVTDENGEAVTERIKAEDAEKTTDGETGGSSQTSAQQSSSGSSGNNSSDGKNTADSSGDSDNTGNTPVKNTTTTTQKQTTTETTTTAKPKRRDIEVTVKLPYYNDKPTELTVYYKADGDKKYTILKTEEITLNYKGENKSKKYTIENIKGDVEVYVELKDITTTQNSATVLSYETEVTISPVTGIEIMDGGMD